MGSPYDMINIKSDKIVDFNELTLQKVNNSGSHKQIDLRNKTKQKIALRQIIFKLGRIIDPRKIR